MKILNTTAKIITSRKRVGRGIGSGKGKGRTISSWGYESLS